MIAGSQKSSWIRLIKCLKKSLMSWSKNGHLSACKRREWDRKACRGYGEFIALISGQCCVFQVFSVSTMALFSLYYLAVNGHVKGLLSFSLLLHQPPAYCLSLSRSLSQPCYTARIHIVTETKPTKQRHQLCCFDTPGFTSTRTYAHISFISLHTSLFPSFTPLRHAERAGKLQKKLKSAIKWLYSKREINCASWYIALFICIVIQIIAAAIALTFMNKAQSIQIIITI